MSSKIEKIDKEIQKLENVIKESQEKLKVLYREKEDTENLEMIDFLRKRKIQPCELKTIVDKLHKENGNIIPLKETTKNNDNTEA